MKWLIPRLPSFLEVHPDVRVRLSESYAPVDYRRDRFDGAIRIVEPDQVHVRTEATPFLAQHQGPVGSPSMMAQLPTIEALASAPRLHSATFRRAWSVWAELAGVTLPPAAMEREFAHNHSLVEAAIAGLGVGIAPWAFVAPDVMAGRLAAPFGFVERPSRFVFLRPEGRPGRGGGRLLRLAGCGRRAQSVAAYSLDKSWRLNQATAAAKGTPIQRARLRTPLSTA